MASERVGYQGVEGSYSSIAVSEYFPEYERVGFPTFEAVVRALQNDAVQYALLPIENSTAGRVADIHQLLPKSDLCVIGEHFLPIHHALIGVSSSALDAITHVYSHREALAQCARTLRERGITPVPFGDTAGAVAHIAHEQNPAHAALASVYAAECHDGVAVLREHLEDDPSNVTRFLVFSKKPLIEPPKGDSLTSIVYEVRDVPSALYTSLGAFARNDVNIIKLESFVPMQHHKDAHFYLECEGSAIEPPLKNALTELTGATKHFIVLGTYEKSAYRSTFEH